MINRLLLKLVTFSLNGSPSSRRRSKQQEIRVESEL